MFTMYGHGGHLCQFNFIYINFRSPCTRKLHIKFGFDCNGQVVLDKKTFETMDGRTTDDGRTDDDDDVRRATGIL